MLKTFARPLKAAPKPEQVTIAKKLGLLLTFMVVVQICLEGIWCTLQLEADRKALIAGDARDVSYCLNGIALRDTALIGYVNDMLARRVPINPRAAANGRLVHVWSKHLQTVGANRPEQKALLNKIESATDELVTQASLPQSAADPALRFKIRQQQVSLISLLQALANWSPYLDNPDRGLDPISRSWLMALVCTGSAMNALLLLLVGRLFLRDIIDRLSIMVDNTVRLKNGRSLQPCLPGADEIAQLDSAFHNMASALTKSLDRQQSLIHNARELVCSLDAQMNFALVSDSALNMLGYMPEQLIGKPISTVVLPGDRNKLLDAISTARDGSALQPLEARVFRADDTILETRWSVKFSERDAAMYCVVHDVSETKAVERLRREVVQMISHDLRSPLAAIHGFHKLLLSGKPEIAELNEQGLRLANMSQANGDRMLELINDLLEIEKMESGMLKLERKQIDLADAVRQALDSVQLLADAKQIKLEAPAESIFINADEKRIVQVLVNLLSNAIKFSRENTCVRVEFAREGEMVELRVIDQGPGIPEDLLGAVFDRFKQLESGQPAKKTGSGLGLAISRALVELHGGQIGVRSAVGQGATFYVRLGVRELVSAGASDAVGASAT